MAVCPLDNQGRVSIALDVVECFTRSTLVYDDCAALFNDDLSLGWQYTVKAASYDWPGELCSCDLSWS